MFSLRYELNFDIHYIDYLVHSMIDHDMARIIPKHNFSDYISFTCADVKLLRSGASIVGCTRLNHPGLFTAA